MSKPERSPITTHILDVHAGKPAAGVAVQLEREGPSGKWEKLAAGVTGPEGRLENLLPTGSQAQVGTYQLTFDTQAYFKKTGSPVFYPRVCIVFELQDPAQHYHVPLLLSGHGYSTYRGT